MEWSKDPAAALATAIYLNDRYNLDGLTPESKCLRYHHKASGCSQDAFAVALFRGGSQTGTWAACGPSVECWGLGFCGKSLGCVVREPERHDMGWPERKIFGKIRYMCLACTLAASVLDVSWSQSVITLTFYQHVIPPRTPLCAEQVPACSCPAA